MGVRRHVRAWLWALTLAPLACGESSSGRPSDTALVDLALRSVGPGTLLPGTVVVVEGDAFVDAPWGVSRLALHGAIDGSDVDLRLDARYVDERRLEVDLDDEAFAVLAGRGGHFEGDARVEVEGAFDGRIYASTPVEAAFDIRMSLQPRPERLQDEGVVFPNEPLVIEGDGLLLGGEGESVVRFEGCFSGEGQSACLPVPPEEVPIVPAGELDRTAGTFAFVPRIAGIEPGHFEGTLTVRNLHVGGTVHESAPIPCGYDLEPPIIYATSTDAASLGQYVAITGAGFVGAGEGDTLLRFEGQFTPDATGVAVPLDVVLQPEFIDGNAIRYVINEADAIGQRLDVRFDTGILEGRLTPTIAHGDAEVVGDPAPLGLRLEPVKQVVFVNFLPTYEESLRHFGLRALDERIRDRVVEVIRRDFATVNLEVRTERPEDFAHYAQVDIGGPDPNGLGLLGYDNSPGKDTGNLRLYDRIGGVNALTQEDGYPGYGGVFIESLFGYSEDPAGPARSMDPDPRFDTLFDPFRPDRGGNVVTAEDLGEGIPALDSGAGCPTDSSERRQQVACAIWALGSLVGTTVSHELGHSLGLADPHGPRLHDSGDAADRLMDADRPFGERAELQEQGPSRFCAEEYDYLRAVLPSTEAYDARPRPSCS